MHHPAEQALEKKAWLLFDQGKWLEASAVFEELLKAYPSSEGGLQGEIACLRNLRQFDKARTLLDDALTKHPRSIGILAEKAWLNKDLKDFNAAIDAFKALLIVENNHKDAPQHYSWLIDLLRLQGRFEEAEKTLQQALLLFPGNYSIRIDQAWLGFYQADYAGAAKLFDELLREKKNDATAIQGKLACLRMLGAFDEAEHDAKAALTPTGRHPGVLNEMAWLCSEKGDYLQASQLFEEVLTRTPRDPYACLNLAGSLIREGGTRELEKASQKCRDALTIDPDLPQARGCLGVVAFKQGRLSEAETQLRKSVDSNSMNGSYADLGALYIRMGRYADAEQILKTGMTIRSNDASIHLELGNLYVQAELLRDAIGEFRQAMAIEPRSSEPVRALAVALMEDGKVVDAETVLRNAIRSLDEFKVWPLHIVLCQLLIKLADETGDTDLCDEALKEANRAITLANGQPDAHFCCGIVRFKVEDYRGALQCFKRCQKLDKTRVDAEINARRVKKLLYQEQKRSRLLASLALSGIILAQLALLWWWRLRYGVDEKHAMVTSAMITVLVPVCLGLIVVSVLLPSLTKLKLTGLEAELSQPPAKETLASGPKGQIGFGPLIPRN